MATMFSSEWAQLKAEWDARTDEERRLLSSGFEDVFETEEDDLGLPAVGVFDRRAGGWLPAERVRRLEDDFEVGRDVWADGCVGRLNLSRAGRLIHLGGL